MFIVAKRHYAIYISRYAQLKKRKTKRNKPNSKTNKTKKVRATPAPKRKRGGIRRPVFSWVLYHYENFSVQIEK
jgi:hypothetical protein